MNGRVVGGVLLLIALLVGFMLVIGNQIGGIIGPTEDEGGEGELRYMQALVRVQASLTFGDDPTDSAVNALDAMSQFESEAKAANRTDDLAAMAAGRPVLQWLATESAADPMRAMADGFASSAGEVIARAEARTKNLMSACAKIPAARAHEQAGLGSMADYRALCQDLLAKAGRSWADAASFRDRHALFRGTSGKVPWDSLVAQLSAKDVGQSTTTSPLPPAVSLALAQITDVDAVAVLSAMSDRAVQVVPMSSDGDLHFCAVSAEDTYCPFSGGEPLAPLDVTTQAQIGLLSAPLEDGGTIGKAWTPAGKGELDLILEADGKAWNLTLPQLPDASFASFDLPTPEGLEGPVEFKVLRDGRPLLTGVALASIEAGLLF